MAQDGMEYPRTSAMIHFDLGGSSCVVRILSENGAAIDVPDPPGIPQEFDLIISGQTARHCRVVWRKRNRLGVIFEGASRSNLKANPASSTNR
jgi:hypothetical protein